MGLLASENGKESDMLKPLVINWLRPVVIAAKSSDNSNNNAGTTEGRQRIGEGAGDRNFGRNSNMKQFHTTIRPQFAVVL